ncbi:hypothetical protein [Pseudomonas brenneri]
MFIQDKRGAFEFFASKLAPTEMLSRLQSLIGGCRADRRFTDQSHMTRQFRSTFGIPPSRWVKMLGR